MNYLSAARSGFALPSRLLRLATSLFACLVAFGAAAHAQSAGGSITGSVTSSQTHNALQGATVSVPSLNRVVFTDEAGRFVVPNVPGGMVEVVVSYTGFSDARQQVAVSSG